MTIFGKGSAHWSSNIASSNDSRVFLVHQSLPSVLDRRPLPADRQNQTQQWSYILSVRLVWSGVPAPSHKEEGSGVTTISYLFTPTLRNVGQSDHYAKSRILVTNIPVVTVVLSAYTHSLRVLYRVFGWRGEKFLTEKKSTNIQWWHLACLNTS